MKERDIFKSVHNEEAIQQKQRSVVVESRDTVC